MSTNDSSEWFSSVKQSCLGLWLLKTRNKMCSMLGSIYSDYRGKFWLMDIFNFKKSSILGFYGLVSLNLVFTWVFFVINLLKICSVFIDGLRHHRYLYSYRKCCCSSHPPSPSSFLFLSSSLPPLSFVFFISRLMGATSFLSLLSPCCSLLIFLCYNESKIL